MGREWVLPCEASLAVGIGWAKKGKYGAVLCVRVGGGRVMMGAWRGDRAVTALELGVAGSWLNIPIFQAAWVAAPGALACEWSRPDLPAADSVPLSHRWAVCSPGWSPAPPSASFVPCGLGRWRGGFHSLSSPDPENNPLYSCDSPHALTSSSHVPRERRNLIPIGQMRTLRPKKGMGSSRGHEARWGCQVGTCVLTPCTSISSGNRWSQGLT